MILIRDIHKIIDEDKSDVGIIDQREKSRLEKKNKEIRKNAGTRDVEKSRRY